MVEDSAMSGRTDVAVSKNHVDPVLMKTAMRQANERHAQEDP